MSNDINSSQPPEIANNKYIREFIDDNQDYYLPRFAKFEATNQKVSWNWPAFLFSAMWVIYRKQYLLFIIIFMVNIPCTFLPEPFYTISTLLVMGFCGVFGNYLYYRHTMRVLSKLSSLSEDRRQRKLRWLGGTSTVGIFIFTIAPVLLIIWILMR